MCITGLLLGNIQDGYVGPDYCGVDRKEGVVWVNVSAVSQTLHSTCHSLAPLYVTAETRVSRLMRQITRAILLFNPIIPHQKGSYGEKRMGMKGENRGWMGVL